MIDTSNLKLTLFKNLKKYMFLFNKANVSSFKEINNLKFEDLKVKLNCSFIDAYSLMDEILKINTLISKNEISDIYEGEIKIVNEPKNRIVLEELGLSVRAFNCLKRAGYDYADEIVSLNELELIKIKNLGRGSLKEILSIIKQIKYKLAMQNEDDVQIQSLELSVRTKNCLLNSGFQYVSEIIDYDYQKFHQIKNMGEKSVKEILNVIEEIKTFSNDDKANWIGKIIAVKNEVLKFKFADRKISNFVGFDSLQTISNFKELVNLSFKEVYDKLIRILNTQEVNFDEVKILISFILKYLRLSDNKLRINLEDRELNVLLQRQYKTLEEIADVYSLTRERIRQIETKALHKLKSFANSHNLKQYFVDDIYTSDNNNSLLNDDVYYLLFDLFSLILDFVKIPYGNHHYYCKKEICELYLEKVLYLKELISINGLVLREDYCVDDILYPQVFEYFLRENNIIKNEKCYYLDQATVDKMLAYIKHFGEIDLSAGNLNILSKELEEMLDIKYFDKHTVVEGLKRRSVISVGNGKFQLLDEISDLEENIYIIIADLIKERKTVDCDDLIIELRDLLPKDINATTLYFKFKNKYPKEYTYGGVSLMISLSGYKTSKAKIVYDYLKTAESPVPNVQIMKELSIEKSTLGVIDSQNEDIFYIDDVNLWLLSKMHTDNIVSEMKKYLKSKTYFFVNDLYKYIHMKFSNELQENFITTFERFHRLMKLKCNLELKEFTYNRFKKDYTRNNSVETSLGFDFDF